MLKAMPVCSIGLRVRNYPKGKNRGAKYTDGVTLAYGNYVSARLKLAGGYYPAQVLPCFCYR